MMHNSVSINKNANIFLTRLLSLLINFSIVFLPSYWTSKMSVADTMICKKDLVRTGFELSSSLLGLPKLPTASLSLSLIYIVKLVEVG